MLVPRVEQETLQAVLAPLETEEVWNASEDEQINADWSDLHKVQDQGRLSQATIRYALTCWLDDLLLHHSFWGHRWRDYTLESTLYGRSHTKRNFWNEVRYAEIRGDLDALEVLYLCVMLGYRGDWRDKPHQVETWTTRIRGLLEKSCQREEPPRKSHESVESHSSSSVPVNDLPYRRMLFTALWTSSFAISAGVVIAVRHWSGQ